MPHLSLRFVASAPLAAALVAAAMLHSTAARAQLPFFPGAEGFGGTFAGTAPAGGWFCNADVYHVTTTQDLLNPSTGKPAVGTLRGAFYDYTNPNSPKQQATNRVVVFDVGGTFQLTEGSLDIKTVNNIYVAGQTAPSPVTIYGNTTQITKSNNTLTSNVVLRYMTFRKGIGDGEDAITFSGGSGAGQTVATNMILDHVSASWAEDEDLSVVNNNTNVTVQYSIIADALTSGHAYGSLIRPQIDSSVSFHHNLYANNASRQARFGTYNAETLTADFRNNVIYNWRDRASYTGGSSEAEQESTDVNYVGNYLVAGSGTASNANRAYSVDKNVDTRVYQSGNFIDSDKLVNPGGVPNGSDLGWAAFVVSSPSTDQTLTQMATPFPTAPVTTQSATNAYHQVLAYVGNSWWSREAIDARIINNVKTNTGPPNGIAAAAPNAAELAGVTGAPTVARPAGYDADADGMPDAWELAHGLNPASAADNKLDFDNDGYVNVVDYLNEVGEFPAPAPIEFNGATNTRYAQITNWKTNDGGLTAGSNWQPSKYDVAQVRSGTATVDAVGQHARTLLVAPAPGDAATLNVTGGWLELTETLRVGAQGAGTVNHSGGLVIANTVTLAETETGAGVYNLSGTGVLDAHVLGMAGPGAFNFTGGVLSAWLIDFDIVNQGGVFSVGGSQMTAEVVGDFTNAAGAIQLDLAGVRNGEFDRMILHGNLAAGGVLDVDLLNGFEPAVGDTFDLFDFASASGAFSLDLPALSNNLKWDASDLLTTGALAVVSGADFDVDGDVDGGDLLIWQRGLGLTGQTSGANGDANGDGAVDGLDLAVWQAHYAMPSASAASQGVPEPAAALLAVAAFCLISISRKTLTIIATPI